MHDPESVLVERLRDAMGAALGGDCAEVDPLIRPAQDRKFGDFQANVAMSLGKRLGRNPRELAAAIVQQLQWAGLCAEAPVVAGPGFINLRLSEEFLSQVATSLAAHAGLGVQRAAPPQTIVVDYSSPNVAKEMHVGHLRSTVIGDALARTLEFLGHKVVRQNHLGDWGTQFGMLIQHAVEQQVALNGRQWVGFGELTDFYRQAKQRFDEDVAFAERARQRVVALQSGDAQTLELWRFLVTVSAGHFCRIYQQLGVSLAEADIRGESFYNPRLVEVVHALRDKGLAVLSKGAWCVFVEGFDDPLMVQKSDGGFGYAATDLAAIRYRVQELGAQRLIYVVDARQADHFAKVFHVARAAGWLGAGHRAEHVRFGTILGEDNRPFKTRAGETVRLADLLHEAQERALAIVREKSEALGDEQALEIARIVGIGAVKYADLSSDRVRDYVFSWPRMLAMDGNTAPYLQYAYARIRSIFRKASDVPGAIGIGHEAERALLLKLAQFSSVVRVVAERLEPHHLCTWLYELATAFSAFYENCPVLRADSPSQRQSRLGLCELTARAIKQGLNLLGIEVSERM